MNTMSTLQMNSGRRLAAAGLTLAVTLLGGCRGDRTDKPPRQFFPDMDDQPKWDPQETTTQFADGRAARPAVPGTVPFGRAAVDPVAQGDRAWAAGYLTERVDFLAEDDAVYLGVMPGTDGAMVYVAEAPVPVTRELIEIGQAKFNIYCATCHGFEGDGKGSKVAEKWAVPVANLLGSPYNDRTQEKGTDGYLFHIAREGLWDVATGANRMPGYKHAIDEHEAWGVVAYVRALQRARASTVDDLTETERERLNAERGAAAAEVAP